MYWLLLSLWLWSWWKEETGGGRDVTRTQFKFPFLNFYERCLNGNTVQDTF